jgi:hypothetical protein
LRRSQLQVQHDSDSGVRWQSACAWCSKKPPLGQVMKKSCSVTTSGKPSRVTAESANGERAFVHV